MTVPNSSLNAQVIATFGRHAEVRDAGGAVHAARPFGRKLAIVCGDRVRCERDGGLDEVHIIDVLPRDAALHRTNARGASEAIVANITQIAVVLAPLPAPDLFVVDRYLCAAASAGVRATLVLNKADLRPGDELAGELAYMTAIGIPLVTCSTRSTSGMSELEEALRDTTAVLVGQSGVGKSSIICELVPAAGAAIGDLVRGTDEGRHTTTASRLYDLPRGGHLIDSPGVRDFAPAIDHLEPSSLGFLEVDRLAPECRFLDCQHMREPGCAVRSGVESGSVCARRYESYRRLRRLYEQLVEARGPGRGARPPGRKNQPIE